MIYRKIANSETILTELMIPSYANFGGKIHGGILLSLMDKVAYITAAKHCSSYAVTVAVEGVEFLNSVEVGDLVSLKASMVGKQLKIISQASATARAELTKQSSLNSLATAGLMSHKIS